MTGEPNLAGVNGYIIQKLTQKREIISCNLYGYNDPDQFFDNELFEAWPVVGGQILYEDVDHNFRPSQIHKIDTFRLEGWLYGTYGMQSLKGEPVFFPGFTLDATWSPPGTEALAPTMWTTRTKPTVWGGETGVALPTRTLHGKWNCCPCIRDGTVGVGLVGDDIGPTSQNTDVRGSGGWNSLSSMPF